MTSTYYHCYNSLLLQFAKSKFACVMVPLEGKVRDQLLSLARAVEDEDLGADGREDDPHVTVLYGLHDQQPDKVEKLLQRLKRPIKLHLGDISYFSGADSGRNYDVLKVDVTSPDLVRLNELLRTLPHTSNFPDYKPHATICYLKQGLGPVYEDRLSPHSPQQTVTTDTFIFSDTDHNYTRVRAGCGEKGILKG